MEQATILTFILLSVTINSFAQIVWKKGVKEKIRPDIKSIIKMLFRPKVMAGLAMYAVSALLWIIVLSNSEVSYAFPFISLGYVTTTILSKLVLHEKIKAKRILGIGIIIAGVIIVGTSL